MEFKYNNRDERNHIKCSVKPSKGIEDGEQMSMMRHRKRWFPNSSVIILKVKGLNTPDRRYPHITPKMVTGEKSINA